MKAIVATSLLMLLLTACSRAPAVVIHPPNAPPAKLSDWGVVFSNGRALHLNAGVMPYELNTPLYSDYALKLRTIWIPDGTRIGYRESGPFEFPVGTIISKTFHYRKAADFSTTGNRVQRAGSEARLDDGETVSLDDHLLVETRLLVRYDDGWRALPYVWNDAQDEAVLEIAGDVREFEFAGSTGSDRFSYVVPDRNQCAGCHVSDLSSKALAPLGPKAWQLNRAFEYPDGSQNQLDRWVDRKLLAGLSATPPAGPRWLDDGAPLEARAKAYLDANCAHCHNERGPADTSALDLSFEAPVDRRYGICKPPIAVGRGSGNRPYDIVPAAPEASILLYRMEQTDPAIAMPELGRSTVHAEGVALTRAWIAALPGEC